MRNRSDSQDPEVTGQPAGRRPAWRRLWGRGLGASGVSLAEVMIQSVADRPVWIADLFWG